MKNATQKTRLLEFLNENPSITPMAAWERLGIYRLSARILELRKDGHDIETFDTIVLNRWGEECRVACYALIKIDKGGEDETEM